VLNRFSALLAVMILAAAPWSAHAAPAGRPLVVAQSIDLSGPNGSIGRDYVAGITTYFDSINIKGGLNGRKISYVVRDDHGVAAEAASNVTALIQDERADYLLGPLGSEATNAVIAAPAFAGSPHMLFAPLADSSGTRSPRAMFWRPTVESEYLFLLTYFGNLGVKDVGIALQETPHNTRTYKNLAAEIRKRGMNMTGVATITSSPASLGQQAVALGRTNPKLVIAIADTIGSAQFLRAFRVVAPATYVAGTSLTNLATLREVAGANATDWAVFSQVVPDPAATGSNLQTEHIKMMKLLRDEPVSSVTLEGFAVAKTLTRMIQQGGTAAPKAPLDLGGMTVAAPDRGQNLSRYVGVALLKRSGALMY
jgi:branched-chain amino acid transport system substrate-binding protein